MDKCSKLLNELHKACRAAIVGIDNIKDEIGNKDLLELIKKQNNYYESYIKDLKKLAVDYDFTPDDISCFMKANSFMVSKMETMMDKSDQKVAEIMINGTKMGISQMDELIHEYEDCDEKLIHYAKSFKEKLENFLNSLKGFVWKKEQLCSLFFYPNKCYTTIKTLQMRMQNKFGF